MSRAADPALHAPGYQMAHCLPPAGIKRPKDLDMYRFHRVVPLYTPDPCIGPSAGQVICPPDCGYEKRNDLMCPAGIPYRYGDSFQFYDTRRAVPEPKLACKCPMFSNNPPCTSLGAVTDPHMCPCVNRPQGQTQAMPMPQPQPQYQQQQLQQPMQMSYGGAVSPHPQHAGQYVGDGGGMGIYEYYVNNKPLDGNTLQKIPLCDRRKQRPMAHKTREDGGGGGTSMRDGAIAPTPHMMRIGPDDGSAGQKVKNQKIVNVGESGNCVSYHCQNPYFPSQYLCRPVFDRKYLEDCPEQNGPHPDHYTFL